MPRLAAVATAEVTDKVDKTKTEPVAANGDFRNPSVASVNSCTQQRQKADDDTNKVKLFFVDDDDDDVCVFVCKRRRINI